MHFPYSWPAFPLLDLSPHYSASSGVVLSDPTSTRPKITRISPTSGAPGITLHIYGSNFVVKGDYIGPVVTFETAPTYTHTRATVINSNEITAPVAGGGTRVYLNVDTAIGKSNSVHFTFLPPVITRVIPPSGGIGQRVTIIGRNLGRKIDLMDIVKFGDSLAHPISWNDNKIVVRAPSDFGTGNNVNLLLDFSTCFGGPVVNGALSIIEIKQSGPKCSKVIHDVLQRLNIYQHPSLYEKRVRVMVRNDDGSATSSFKYRVFFQKGT